LKIIRGRVIKYPDSVDTDAIIPARYLNITDSRELAKHVFEDYDPKFRLKVKTHPIIVAGGNFGCGSSREHAVIALKTAGVKAIVAESYARIFFRNSINLGLPALQVSGVSSKVSDGDEISIDLENWKLKNHNSGITLEIKPLPSIIMGILESGGLENYLKERKGKW